MLFIPAFMFVCHFVPIKHPFSFFFKQSWFSCYISSPSFPVHLLLLINSGLVQVSYNYWVGLYFCLNRKFYAKQNVCICFFYADILHALVFIIYCLNLYPEWSFYFFFFHSSNSASWWYKVDSRCGFWLCLLYCPIGLRTEVPVEVKFQAQCWTLTYLFSFGYGMWILYGVCDV